MILACCLAAGQTRLWEGAKGAAAKVRLTAFVPEDCNGTGVIICPGGSYFWLDTKNEGALVAKWLNDNNIAAFVLEYRTAGKIEFVHHFRSFSRGTVFPDMLSDLQMALGYVRRSYPLERIGVMGFSAGGHLAMLSAELGDRDFTQGLSMMHSPDFVAAIYPVVTMSDERYVHRRSRRGLMGDRLMKSSALRDSLSLERHAGRGLPPVFLLACEDDPTVDFHNSMLLDSALRAEGVPHEFLLYKSGGHGFGANPRRQEGGTSLWQKSFIDWLNTLQYDTRH
ncbi:MAG: alpha/beta hydrolase [Bacteroidales bacterium]|nr:alpha/beta hydrolase [Bacteroidales bacterium]